MIDDFPDHDEEADLLDRPFSERVQKMTDILDQEAEKLPLRATLQPWKNRFTDEIQGIELNELYADKPGSGAGSIFMQRLCDLADKMELSVYVSPENPRSKEFYQRFGFGASNAFAYLARHPPLPFDIDEEPEGPRL